MSRRVIVKTLSLSFLLVAVILVVKGTMLTEFTTEQQLTLGLLAFAVYLWIAAPIPTGAISILLLACMLILGLVETVEEAVAGFLSPAIYFIFVLSLISQSLTKVGIDRVIARLVIKLSKGGSRFIVIMLPIVFLLLPIILPSAIARYKIFLPLIDRLNDYYGYNVKSLFKKYCMYVLGMLNQNATMIIFTGGGFPVLASQLMKDYEVAEFSWLGWFLRMAPPLWIGMCLFAFVVWYFLKLTTPKQDWLTENMVSMEVEKEKEKIPARFWIVMVGFLTMVLAWIVTDHQRIPLVLPPMLLVVFYALPKINIITNQVIRSFDWENFLLLGSSFSIGILMAENGTAKAVAAEMMKLIPADASLFVKVSIIALFVFMLRFLFAVPSSAMVVIFPIVISYSELIGISQIALAFMIVMIVGGMMVLPIHSPTIFYVYDSGIFAKKEQYVIGIASSVMVVVIAVFSALYFW